MNSSGTGATRQAWKNLKQTIRVYAQSSLSEGHPSRH